MTEYRKALVKNSKHKILLSRESVHYHRCGKMAIIIKSSNTKIRKSSFSFIENKIGRDNV